MSGMDVSEVSRSRRQRPKIRFPPFCLPSEPHSPIELHTQVAELLMDGEAAFCRCWSVSIGILNPVLAHMLSHLSLWLCFRVEQNVMRHARTSRACQSIRVCRAQSKL